MFHHCRFIDCTHKIHPEIPTWRGCGFMPEIKIDYLEGGLRAQVLRMHAGVGTHIDAPAHFIEGGASVAEISLEKLIVPARIMNVTKEAHEDFLLTPAHIKEHETQYGPLEKGTFVAIHTGWADRWIDPKAYRNVKEDGLMHYPRISGDAAEILIEKGVCGMGVDTLSPDPEPALSPMPWPVHHIILGAGRYIVENLANLSHMPIRSHVMILPLPMVDVVESPVRVVGIYQEEK